MPTKRDYYEILGLSKGASIDEVKRAYKKLAKKYHPDISKEDNAEDKFKEVLEAYQGLSDPQKKANYDRFGHAAEGFQGFQGFRGANARDFEFDMNDLFNNLGSFGDMFRGAFGQGGPRTGASIRHDLNISFEEAAFGTEKEITIPRIEKCGKCDGFGGEGSKRCTRCNGARVIRREQRTPFGTFVTQTQCPECKGKGTVVEKVCKKCSGKGIDRVKKKINVKIPAGIDSGNHLRLAKMGNAGKDGGGYGDLYVVVFVDEHEVFKRDGADIYAEIPISFSEAVLGTKIDVPTLRGEGTIKIPGGTQTGTIFRLKDKGIKDLSTGRTGDEYVKVIVQVPKKVSKKERDLIEGLAEEDSLKKERKGFFERIAKKFKH